MHDNFRYSYSYMFQIDGFKVWEATSLTPHLSDLWLYFKKELLPCSDEQFYKPAISALTALLQHLNNVDLINIVEGILASMILFIAFLSYVY